MPRKFTCCLIFLIFLPYPDSFGQNVDTTSFKMNSRLNFYSFEESGEMILHVPQNLIWTSLNIILTIKNAELSAWKGIPGKKLLNIPFPLNTEPGNYVVTAQIKTSGGSSFKTATILQILDYKRNEVKTDVLTGGLVVNKRAFFPFGFYCYSPVHPTLPEEEAVKGFNMMSPYQRILPETFNERKTYMDRCAEIGMKVNYNLLSVSGGGGVSSQMESISESEKRDRLIAEIKTFMDHPALLAWYISDEPNGNNIPPSELENIYRLIKKTDPWHPVSVVFMAPFLESRKYADALDIVMADPYPVPNGPVSQVGDVAGQLRTEFEGKKPVWIVPQSFGGGEWWSREPTLHEMRSMTYQAIVKGARGIQYFVRHGLNSFPKSTSTWNECGRIAVEIAEITPWLLSDEKAPAVSSSTGSLMVMSALRNNQVIVIAVNKINSPQRVDISISGPTSGIARVLFENRTLPVSSGILSDNIPAFGSQVYLVNTKNLKSTVIPYKDNLIKDPGFEDLSHPGIPVSCYAWNEGDRGSTYFLDTRDSYEGTHSLRLITPKENMGTRLRFFPMNIVKGRTYILSVWAKTDPDFSDNGRAPAIEIGLGTYGSKRFYPGNEWRQFVTSVTIPVDTIPSPRANVILRMPGKGTAWFDMIQAFEARDIGRSINPEVLSFPWEKLYVR